MSQEELEAQDGLEIRPELMDKLSELEILRQSFDEMKEKSNKLSDELLRQHAEMQTFRRRSEQRIIDARRAGKEEVLGSVLSLADAMVQAQISAEGAKDVEVLKKGIALLKNQVDKFLTDQGLVAIEAKGKKLDPNMHEAIAQVIDPSLEDGLIVDEIQRGYTLNGAIVRPSRVRVASHPAGMAQGQSKEEQDNG